jgi:LPXTG-site transpeptidase (sortase) family protein
MAGATCFPYTSATLKGLHVYGGLFAVAMLVALATLAALPTTQAARTDPRPAEAVPAGSTIPADEKASKPSRAGKAPREAVYNKLSLTKLSIKRPAPKKPAPARKPEHSEKKAERSPQAGASVSVLPGQPRRAPARRVPKKEPLKKDPPRQEPTRQEPPKQEPPKRKVPEGHQQDASVRATVPHNVRLLLSIPRLGIEDMTIGDSSKQAYLDREGIMHLSGTGFPYQRSSNTYIVGHAGDYDTSRIPNPFRNLKELRPGDFITLRDATGKTYNYRIYDRFVVSPRDVWVMDPVAGRNIVTFQTCFPAPTFDKRLIVRGELVR